MSRNNSLGIKYLQITLDSIISTTTKRHKEDVVVVVFLADKNLTYNSYVHNILHSAYNVYITSGFIRIVEADPRIYPKMKNIKKNFGDTQQRVLWRAKQVLDFAFMFSYSKDISEYYIQIEDDVECADHFVDGIRNFVWDLKSQNQSWALLEFSVLGFIGKLVKSADLDRFTDFLLLFYEEEPVDWLITPFRESMAQLTPIVRKPTLFQHWGTLSSYDANVGRGIRDKHYRSDAGLSGADNPPATVYTNLEKHKYTTRNIYGQTKSTDEIFWAKPPIKDRHITLVFDKPHLVGAVSVETGDATWLHDRVKSGEVQASISQSLSAFTPDENKNQCGNFTTLGEIITGSAFILNVGDKMQNKKVRCIRLVIKPQTEKVIIRGIYVLLERGKPPKAMSPFRALARENGHSDLSSMFDNLFSH